MRIFNRAHLPWFIFVLVASSAAFLLYVDNFYPERFSRAWHGPRLTGDTPGYVNVGATPLGLIFGSIAFAIFLFAGLLGLRKKVVLWPIGTVQRWLRAHVWLTLLTIPLVILHTGFRLGGPMTTLLVLIYAVVMASGIYGLALQHYLPKLMKERLPIEVVYEQIPYIRAQLCSAAEKVRERLKTKASLISSMTSSDSIAAKIAVERISDGAASIETPSRQALLPAGTPFTFAARGVELPPDAPSETVLIDFIESHALPYLRKRHGQRMQLANLRYSEDMFRFLRLRVGEEYEPIVEEIQGWCKERRMLDYQTRLHHWLHRWLFVHVPLSYLLILITAWHAFVTLLRY